MNHKIYYIYKLIIILNIISFVEKFYKFIIQRFINIINIYYIL